MTGLRSQVSSPGSEPPQRYTKNNHGLETLDVRRRVQRGFTLFELAVSLLVISVLAAVLLGRLYRYQEMAEKASMEATVRLVKTGLQIRLAELIITNRQAQAPLLELEDPLRWLDKKPDNYGGAYRRPARPGTWYFDEQARQLVYVVNTADRLEIDTGRDPRELRFRARLVTDRVQAPGGPVEGIAGITVTPVRPYRWP